MKIYTRGGDDGTTGLFGAKRVRKDDVRIEAYGEVDEVNAQLGVCIAHLPSIANTLADDLAAIQNDLFVIGSLLATPAGTKPSIPVIDSARALSLESRIDAMESDLPPLKNFILPQGSLAGTALQVARAVSRRAERRVVALSSLEDVAPAILIYLNRLSDFLFVAARWVNLKEGQREIPWSGSAGVAADPTQPDKLVATLNKLEVDKHKRQTLFERTSADLDRKKNAADKLFRQSVEQINKDGGKVEKPLRDFDLD